MNSKKRISQAEIAKELGVSKGTVSLVLRGIGNFSEETQDKIRRLAREKGYVPDPMLGALSAYRKKGEQQPFMGTLGFLLPNRGPMGGFLGSLWRQGQKRAVRLGYRLERFSMDISEMSPTRLGDVLQARGIRGLIVGQKLGSPFWDEFAWDKFASISVTRVNAALPMDMVNHDATNSSHYVWNECVKRGYRRLMVFLNRESDQNIQRRFSNTFLGLHRDHPETFIEEPIQYTDILKSSLKADWIKRHRPDAIICHDEDAVSSIQSSTSIATTKLSIACLSLQTTTSDFSGVHHPRGETMDATLALLDHKIRHDVVGLPKHKRTVLLEGKWIDGKSLRSS
ncbi:MAG: LacI family DNA-binding transcriptional regulator [Verrucomicrobiota bacterium]